MQKLWGEEEISYLKQLYENNGLSASELFPIFNKKYGRPLDGIKIKIGRLKLRHSKQQIKNIKSRLNLGELNGMFGKQSAMLGLTSKTSALIKCKSEKTSKTRKELFKLGILKPMSGATNPMYGTIAWNKGLTKHSDGRLLEYGKKISIIKKFQWQNKTDEDKKKIIIRLNDAMIQNNKSTKIENIIEEFLIKNNISYIKNKRFDIFIFDFYLLTPNLVIECDGDYWHVNPMFYKNKKLTVAQLKNIERDKRKNLLLEKKQIRFVRFWENDIKNNFEMIKQTIWEKLREK